MRGFFPGSQIVGKAPTPRLPKCGLCRLHTTCLAPKMPPTGSNQRSILIVGEAPGKNEDEQNIQFCGPSGERLKEALGNLGVNLRKDCLLTNSLICRPPKNRTPADKELEYCLPNLISTIKENKPTVIIPLGGSAVKQVMGYVWRDSVGPVSRWAGFQIPSQKLNAWICPTFHPSYVMREEGKSFPNPVVTNLWEHHLSEAIAHKSKPWRKLPDYKSQVAIVRSPKRAARMIRKIIRSGKGAIAFDYETNMLKPEGNRANIVSASIAWGDSRVRSVFAYPWQGEAIAASAEILSCGIPKIASNLKFEERWTKKVLGFGVKNWMWDTMLAAHVIDQRPDITGLKFQAFVLLGFESYDDHIKQFLQNKEGETTNRILTEIDLDQLLLYNGLDSLLEFEVAMLQREYLGYKSFARSTLC